MDNKDFNRDQLLNEILRETAAPKAGSRCSGSPAGTGRTGTSCGSTADTAAAGCGNTGTGSRQPHCSFQQCPVEYGSGVHRPAAGIGK